MPASVAINIGPEVPGSKKYVYGVITFDSSYETGGEAVTLTQLGLNRLDWIQLSGAPGYVANWDGSLTNPKILLWRQNATTGPLQEVPATTNVSTVTVRFRAVGA